MTPEQYKRFMSKVYIGLGPDQCWLWDGNCASNGYGRLGIGDKAYLAHQLICEHFYGPIRLAGLNVSKRFRGVFCIEQATKYGVSRQTVSDILNNRIWKQVKL